MIMFTQNLEQDIAIAFGLDQGPEQKTATIHIDSEERMAACSRDYISAAYFSANTINLRVSMNLLLNGILKTNKIPVQQFYLTFNNIKLTKETFVEAYYNMLTHNNADPVITDDTYKITTIYVNQVDDNLTLPLFKEETNPALYACFKHIREKNNEVVTEKIQEEFVYDKIFVHKTKKEIVRVVNYVVFGAPTRTSNLEIITGSNYRLPETHVLLALLPVLAENVTTCLTQEEIELFRLSADPYTMNTIAVRNRLEVLFSLDKYRNTIKEKKFLKLKERFIATTITIYDNKILRLQRRIEELASALMQEERQLTNINMEKLYYTIDKEKATAELNYLAEHPYLYALNISGDNLILSVRVPLTVWDPEEASIIYKNLENLCRDYNIDEYNVSFIKFFFDTVLLKQTATYYMESCITLNMESFEYRYRQEYGSDDLYRTIEAAQAGYNPHIERYQCTGSHKTEINRARNSKQLSVMFEALLNPVKNWNLSDGAVLREGIRNMIPALLKRDIKCLEYKNTMYSIQDLYNKLNTTKGDVDNG